MLLSCVFTVFWEIYSRTPISLFENPSAASFAISISLLVRTGLLSSKYSFLGLGGYCKQGFFWDLLCVADGFAIFKKGRTVP